MTIERDSTVSAKETSVNRNGTGPLRVRTILAASGWRLAFSSLLLSWLTIGLATQCFAQSLAFVYRPDPSAFPGNISAWVADHANGTLSAVPGSPFPGSPDLNTSNAVAIDPTGRFAYVGSYCWGGLSPSTLIFGYSINATTGALSPLPGSPYLFPECAVSSLAIERSGRYLYASGSTFAPNASGIFVYSISQNGDLVSVQGGFTFTQSVENLTVHPNNRFLYSSGVSALAGFEMDSATGKLSAMPPSQFPKPPAGFNAPQHPFIVESSGHFAYASAPSVDALNVRIFSYGIDTQTGAWTELVHSPLLIPVRPLADCADYWCPGRNGITDLAATPDGRFLYAGVASTSDCGLYGCDVFGGFLQLSVDTATGALTLLPLTVATTDGVPYSLAVDSGGFVDLGFVDRTLSQSAGRAVLSMYRIDSITGGLTQTSRQQINITGVTLGRLTLALPSPSNAPTISTSIPQSGGNGGQVTVNLVGTGFAAGAQFRLVGSGRPDIVASQARILSSTFATVVFNLTGAPSGPRDLLIANPDGTSAAIVAGFVIAEAGAASLHTDIIGPHNGRGGANQLFFVTCSNTGNLDAALATIWISFPSDVPWSTDSDGILAVNQVVGSQVLIGIDVRSIPVGTTSTVPIMLVAPPQYFERSITIQAWDTP